MVNNILITFRNVLFLILFLPLLVDVFNKKDKNKSLKESIVMLFLGILLAGAFTTLLLMPISFAYDMKNNLFLFVYLLIIGPYLLVKLIAFFVNYFKVITSKDNRIYVRDIFVDYSPAVLSLLLNHKIEDKKDFDATVLNIHAKRVIDFTRVDDKLNVVDLKNVKAIQTLTRDEIYIYRVLTQQEKFDKQKWHDLIQLEINDRKLVRKGKRNIFLTIGLASACFFGLSIFLFIIFILAVLFAPGDFFKNLATNYDYDLMTAIPIILALIPIQLVFFEGVMLINKRRYLKNRMDYYTEKGAMEMLKWQKFKAFIEDFSMISSATAESVVLWEKYIAYAMACNINKSYNSPELHEINKAIQQGNWLQQL